MQLKFKNASFGLVFSLILASTPAFAVSETIKKEQIKSLISIYEQDSTKVSSTTLKPEHKIETFNKFLNDIQNYSKNYSLKNSIKLFKDRKISEKEDWINIYRLLGIYSRIKYKKELISVLGKLVSIPTYIREDIPQYKNPNIIKFGQEVKRLAENFGLEYKNIDNRIFEVKLKGSSNDSFGIYTHSDIVPADKSKWILDDGTKLDPYKMKVIGNNIYGRGTEDDKCSIVVSLFAMKIIKENGFKLKRSIRLLIETTEETSGEGIEYYKEKNKVPDYNIVLDSAYPVVTAEKGFGIIAAKFKVKKGTGNGPEIINITGGLAYNQIPSTSVTTIVTSDPSGLENKIKKIAEEYIKVNGKNFKIKTSINKKHLLITVIGKSAHSSAPQNGINPVALMFNFLSEADKQLNFKNNHFKDAVSYVNDNFGLDYYGNKLGIAYKDDFMGPLTAALTFVSLADNQLEVSLNLRAPKGKEPPALKSEIIEKLKMYQQKNNNDFIIDVSTGDYMYRNVKGEWINTLLNVFGDVTGKEAKPVSSSGGTTAKQLPKVFLLVHKCRERYIPDIQIMNLKKLVIIFLMFRCLQKCF